MCKPIFIHNLTVRNVALSIVIYILNSLINFITNLISLVKYYVYTTD